MVRTLLRTIVWVLLFMAFLENCVRGALDIREQFEYEDLDLENIEPRASERPSDPPLGRSIQKKKGPTLPSSKPFLQLAQGKYMLFYIPGVKHCDLVNFQLWDPALEEWNDMGCSEAPTIGWMWVFNCVPDKVNRYRAFGKTNLRPILIGETISLLDKPPPIKSHIVTVGPGWTSIWVKLPEEDQPNLLGIKVRFIDEEWNATVHESLENIEEWSKGWNLQYFEQVKYAGTKAMLWPVQNCPQWPKSKMFCMLFTDKFTYTESWKAPQRPAFVDVNDWWLSTTPKIPPYAAETKVFFMMETFRIPNFYPLSTYGDKYNVVANHFNCHPMRDCPLMTGRIGVFDRDEETPEGLDDIDMEPMFPVEGGDRRRRPKRRPWPRESQLWVIFIVLTLFLLAVILPIVFYFATRAGYRAADAMWSSWAEAPGNLIVGLGYTTVAWQGQQPAWKYEPRG